MKSFKSRHGIYSTFTFRKVSLGIIIVTVFYSYYYHYMICEKSPHEEGLTHSVFSFEELERKSLFSKHDPDIDCRAIMEGDIRQLANYSDNSGRFSAILSDNEISTDASNCNLFRQKFGFIMSSLTEEEEKLPIAYSILVFKDSFQIVGLLRAIYRPQNVYCIHIDMKADAVFRDAVRDITACLPNVFLSSRSVDVRWGEFSVLESEIVCMKDLWSYRVKWKYFINLTGQEFPLKTNWELVQILKAFKNANSVEGTRKRANKERWKNARRAPPGGIQLSKGNLHVTLNRDFVDFILHSSIGQAFLNWSRDEVLIPDESYFSSLNHNPQLGIKGTYLGEAETNENTYPYITRFISWGNRNWCKGGVFVRSVCIFSIRDLPVIASRPELFANKFYIDYSKDALICLGEAIYNRTRDRAMGLAQPFNISFYETLPFVKNQVVNSTFKTFKNH